jgi:hypothetical protein
LPSSQREFLAAATLAVSLASLHQLHPDWLKVGSTERATVHRDLNALAHVSIVNGPDEEDPVGPCPFAPWRGDQDVGRTPACAAAMIELDPPGAKT